MRGSIGIVILFAWLWGGTSLAQKEFDHSVTGFDLNGAHAAIECVECHKQTPQAMAKGRAFYNWTGLKKACYPCHSDYHGYGKEVSTKQGPLLQCQSCHNDVRWKDSLRFDHNIHTIFGLTGKHKDNACFDCHKPTTMTQAFKGEKQAPYKAKDNTLRRYMFPTLPTKSCETCHITPHTPAFHKKFKGVTCDKCHTTEGWNVMSLQGQINADRSFHDKTRFPLTGDHKTTPCKSCHLVDGKEVFKFPNAEKQFCVNCHTNVHKNQFSERTQEWSCATCHTTTDFVKRLPFDHDKTSFKLTGKHEKIESQCVKCHVPTQAKLPTKPPKTAHLFNFSEEKDPKLCANCHTTVHKEQFNPETLRKSCAECHSTQSFAKLLDFNHDVTRFKLTGRHADIGQDCAKCHKPSDITLPTKPPRRGNKYMFEGHNRGFCEECHVNEHKDMFKPKFANRPCATCHLTEVFTKRKDFDHDETDFELKGKHKQVKCVECHEPTKERYKYPPQNRKGDYQFPEFKTKNCAACHEDVHKGSNGPNCMKCHNESGWKNAGEFHKDFLLKGVHLQLDCKECHVNDRVLHGTSQECSVCHMKDDPHNSQLQPCAECHLQNFWNQTTFDHNMTRFMLQGAHRVTECRACHNQGVYQGLPTDCRSCHAQDAAGVTAPDHSQPEYYRCDACHNVYFFGGAIVQ